MNENENVEKLNRLIDLTYKTITDMESAKLKKNSHVNVTNSELHILSAIGGQEEGCTITQLAHIMGYSLPTITVAVNKMESKGFVVKEKSEEDKREVRIRLTRQGEKINNVRRYIYRRISRDLANSFTEEEQLVLIRGLEKIIQLFRTGLYTGDDL